MELVSKYIPLCFCFVIYETLPLQHLFLIEITAFARMHPVANCSRISLLLSLLATAYAVSLQLLIRLLLLLQHFRPPSSSCAITVFLYYCFRVFT
jgi:hypothetical protein